MFHIKTIVLFTFISCAYTIPPIPQYLKPCSKLDDNCMIKSANEAIPNIAKGDKKFGIAGLQPLFLPEVQINSGDSFKLNLKNVDVIDLDTAEVKKIKIYQNHIDLTLFVPHLEIYGDYIVNGQILILPLQGTGKVNITATAVTLNYKTDLQYFDKKNNKYAKLINDKSTFEVGRAYFNFDNLFNGDKKLGDHVNTFLNDNWQDIINELGGAIGETIAQIIHSIINNYFEKIPQDQLFLN